MIFALFKFHLLSYFYDSIISKFCDIVNFEACNFINNCFNSNTLSVLDERSKLISDSHAHSTRSSSKGLLFAPSYNTSGPPMRPSNNLEYYRLKAWTYCKKNIVIMIL